MKYVIVDSFDAPYQYNVAECIDGKYYYMARSLEGRSHLKHFDGMTPKRPTRMEDFGFCCSRIGIRNEI